MVVAHAFRSSTWEAEAGRSLSEASLVYRVSSRSAKATQRNPDSKNQNKKTKQNKKDLFISCTLLLSSDTPEEGIGSPLKMVVSHHVVAENCTQDPWKSSQCS